MEELNNNVVEEIMEVVEPVETFEVSEIIESKEEGNGKALAIGAVVVTGLVAGGVALKKLWDKRKKSKEDNTSRTTVEFQDVEEVQDVEVNE